MQIIESEGIFMSDEKRKLEESLAVADDYFAKNGLLDAINSLCNSEEVTDIIEETKQKLISNMKQIEDVLQGDCEAMAKKLREVFERNSDTFRKDVIASFKLNLQATLHLCLDIMSDDEETRESVRQDVRDTLHEVGIEQIKTICRVTLKKDTDKFRKSACWEYTPEGLSQTDVMMARLVAANGPSAIYQLILMGCDEDDD